LKAPKEKFKGEIQLRQRMSEDFPYYAKHNLKIKGKSGGLEDFNLNKAQLFIHETIEKQKKDTGRVRVIVVKARQQGCSTYTAGRFYWITTKTSNIKTFVFSHAQFTTDELFSITHRYHTNADPMFKPSTSAMSKSSITFSALGSDYSVGTAGAVEVGRGITIQNFHGSEVGFWANPDMHFAGVMQAIPSGDLAQGTEVILESTANGKSGKFYDIVQDALRGDSEYIVVFTPWFWQSEYSDSSPVEWEVPISEKDYQEEYQLSDEQMWWRHNKIRQLGSEWKFKQEYPCSIDEAFQTSDEGSYIKPALIMACRSSKPDVLDIGPRIGACDPAWTGDRAGLGYRTGSRFNEIVYFKDKDPTELSSICKDYIEEKQLDRLFVDVIGIGAGVYSNLKADGYGDIVKPCNFSSGTTDLNQDGSKKYFNHRAECWGRMREWMEEGPVEVPNSDELAADLAAPQYHYSNTMGALQLESKKDMRKRGVSSPDGGDVLAMTFSSKVHKNLRNKSKSGNLIPEYDVLNF